MWVAFAEAKGFDPRLYGGADPAFAEDAVLAFLAYLRQDRCNGFSSLKAARSALASYFKFRRLPDPTKGPLVGAFLRGVARLEGGGDAPQRKLPFSARHMEALHDLLDLRGREGTAMWAGACLGFFFMLRVGNIAGKRGGAYDSMRIVRRRDVTFYAGAREVRLSSGLDVLRPDLLAAVDRVKVHVRKSKADQRARGFTRELHRSGHAFLCPVRALLDHCMATVDLPADWPVVAFDPPRAQRQAEEADMAGRVVTREQLSNVLKAVGQQLGEDPRDFASHSLRIGGATAMHGAGFSDAWIMFMGNWASAAYLIYCRASSELPKLFAQAMAHSTFQARRDFTDHNARRRGGG